MTYQPHALLKFGGRWFTTEEWSCGLRIITNDNANVIDGWVAAAPNLLVPFKDLVQAWFIDVDSQHSSQARLDYVSLNAIGPDGLYADQGTSHEFVFPAATAPTGPALVNTWPQLTLALSLRTEVKRGRGTHGRIYAPVGLTATATGRISNAQCTGIGGELRDLCQDIAGEADLSLIGFPRVAVVSSLGEPGPARIVTDVLVGDVMDTQRRRRGSLPEAYATVPVVT